MKKSKIYNAKGEHVTSKNLHPCKSSLFSRSPSFNQLVHRLANKGLFTKRNLPK